MELLPKGPFFNGIPAPEKTFLELHLGQFPVFNISPPFKSCGFIFSGNSIFAAKPGEVAAAL